MAVGCSDYEINDVKGATDLAEHESPGDTAADTGDVDAPSTYEWDAYCPELPLVSDFGGVCTYGATDLAYDYYEDEDGNTVNKRIQAITVLGRDGSEEPAETTEIYFYKDAWDDDYYTDVLYYPGDGVRGFWGVTAIPADLGDVNAGPPIGPWLAAVDIHDSTRAYAEECDDYETIHVCFAFDEFVAAYRPPNDSTCQAGNGSFVLHPMDFYDNDGDGEHTVLFQAVQVSGTGRLTDAAWIREITATETQGETLRVIKLNQVVDLLPNDLLANPSTVSGVVSSLGSGFASGVVSGGAPFLVEEVPGTADAEFTVDMEWECGTPPQGAWVTPPLGYLLDTDTLQDCTLDIPQVFVLRPHFQGLLPYALHVMPYGQLNMAVTIPVQLVGNQYVWEYDFLDFHVEGSVGDWDANELELMIDDISWNGLDLCDPGTYLLPASQ